MSYQFLERKTEMENTRSQNKEVGWGFMQNENAGYNNLFANKQTDTQSEEQDEPFFGRIYIVKSGDTLSEIAVRFNTTVKELVTLNPSFSGREHSIYPGEEIKLPQLPDKKRETNEEKFGKEQEFAAEQIPENFNYQLINHRLNAYTYSNSDLNSIKEFINFLYKAVSVEPNSTQINNYLENSRKDISEGQMVQIDITEILPEHVQKYLAAIERYFKEQRNGDPSNVIPSAYTSACHDFTSLLQGNIPSEVNNNSETDKQGMPYFNSDPFEQDIQKLVDEGDYKESKYKIVAQGSNLNNVKIGDIAVFVSGVELFAHGEGPDPFHQLRTGQIIHSATIMKVSGSKASEIELLEKKDPFKDTATRTINDVLEHYSDVGAQVYILRKK